MAQKKSLSLILAVVLMWASPAFSLRSMPSAPYQQSVYHFLKEKSGTPEVSFFEHTLMGLSFLSLGDWDAAERQIGICLEIRMKGEHRLAGPELWLALLCFQYEQFTQNDAFRKMGENICAWYLSLPKYEGLPAMGESEERIPWGSIVSLEDAQLAKEVISMGAILTQDADLQKQFEAGVVSVSLGLKKWEAYPQNSFLLFGMFADHEKTKTETRKAFTYAIANNIHIVTDHFFAEAATADSPWVFLRGYWSSLEKTGGEEQEKRQRYQKMRRVVQSLDNFLDWKEQNNLKVYDRSHTEYLSGSEEWFLPEEKKSSFNSRGVADVCFDFFQQSWNPLRLEPVEITDLEETPSNDADHAAGLAHQAKLHLLAGETKKAEELAQQCVDLYGTNKEREIEEAVASSWLILGKIYHDLSGSASSKFKFSLADHYSSERDRAFQQVRQSYPTASVIQPKRAVNRVWDVIKKIYD